MFNPVVLKTGHDYYFDTVHYGLGDYDYAIL